MIEPSMVCSELLGFVTFWIKKRWGWPPEKSTPPRVRFSPKLGSKQFMYCARLQRRTEVDQGLHILSAPREMHGLRATKNPVSHCQATFTRKPI